MTKEYSKEGKQGLLIHEKNSAFTDWMYQEIKPYIQGNILEVGSGLGTYSKKLIEDFKNNKIILSDIDPESIQILKTKFRDKATVIELDISRASDFEKINQKPGSILCLNVLEHIEDDISAINNIYDMLNTNGRFIILVPAHKFLFNSLDTSIGHYRRYTKKEIVKKVLKTRFKIKNMFYFNFFSILGWYINGNIMKKKVINENAISLFNKFVPIFRFIEKKILIKKMGISLIVILEKG